MNENWLWLLLLAPFAVAYTAHKVGEREETPLPKPKTSLPISHLVEEPGHIWYVEPTTYIVGAKYPEYVWYSTHEDRLFVVDPDTSLDLLRRGDLRNYIFLGAL